MKRFISSLCALSILFACTQEEPAPIRVESIELDSEELELIEGNTVSLVATILPEDAENQNVIWSSSNKAVASVKDGEVTALKVGEAVITATSEDGGKKATCKVVVSAKHIPVSSVTLDKEEVSLILEDKITLTATVAPENASNKTIVWTSSDESIVTVTDGEVTALKTGEAVITAKSADGDKKASCKVTVYAKPVPVTGVSLNKQKARVFSNDELTLTATVAPEDATNKTLIWTTSNALVATVKNGVVKGISVGEADITVKTEDGNHGATCKVSVTEESQTQTKGPLTLDLGIVTSTTATFNGVLDVDMLGDYDMNAGGVGFIYAPADQPLNIVTSSKVQISEVDSQGKFTHTLTGLKYNSEYHYAIFVYKNTICQYGETQVFETVPVDMELSVKDITQTRATIAGRLTLPENDKELEVGVLCSTSSDMTIATEGVKKAVVTDIMDADGGFSHRAEELLFDNTHYCRHYVKQGDTYTYGSVLDFKTETVSGSISVSGITQTRATFNGRIELTEDDLIEVGVLYSQESDLTVGASGVVKQRLTPDQSGNIAHQAEKLQYATTYNYCYYAYQDGKYIYGETKTFTTQSVSMNISVRDATQTTATFNGSIKLTEQGLIEVGVLCSTGDNLTVGASGVIKKTLTTDSSGNVSGKVENLQFNTPYNYCYYICQNGKYTYGSPQTFTTSSPNMTLSVDSITQTTATFNGKVDLTEEVIEVGVLYSTGADLTIEASGVTKKVLTPDSSGNVSFKAEGLQFNTPYNYCYYICQNGKYIYGETKMFTTLKLNVVAQDLSVNGTANCYIISESGTYKIEAVKGNSNESVGEVASAEVLWESFGTQMRPNIGDLITWASCSKTEIVFEVSSDFKEGNAVIAAKDASGNILWSWHIWLTDQPQGQEYYNNAGTMMDRNLGATSATPGDVGALGLLYQWGRKDPFLSSSSISSDTIAKSTITWPSGVESSSATGTVDYVISNPTTFVIAPSSGTRYDWHYASRDNTLWTTSDKTKSIYDPCPAGWRVPDGGSSGIWSKAGFDDTTYDSTNKGISFSISSPSTTWYPASGYRDDYDGSLYSVGRYGYYWSASPSSYNAYYLYFYNFGYVYPSSSYRRALGLSVRCLQE